MINKLTLETERLILRPWEESDAESLYEYAKDDRIGPVAGWPPHSSVENSRRIIRTVLSEPETYAVCLKEDNKAIGSISLKLNGHTDMTDRDDECELGYWLGVPYWGRGIIPEAARELLRHGFADLGMRTVWCGYYDGNIRSKRVQEKCGFIYHHSCSSVPVPLLNETRAGHTNILKKEDWKNGFILRQFAEDERASALSLAWKVFSQYEAPDYSPEGAEEFHRCLRDENFLAGIEYIGAFDGDAPIGMVGIRKENCHICFFFVEGKYQRLGIGTRLFECVKAECFGKTITVNSSPYGLPFYRSLGFRSTDGEQTVNGIRFIPMQYQKEDDRS